MLHLALNPIPQSMWGQGDKGFGKTLTAKCFVDEVQARGVALCFYFDWEHKLTKTLEGVNEKYGLDIPSYTLSASSIARKIIETTSPNQLLVFLIDEPQKAWSIKDVDDTVFRLYQAFLGQRKASFIFLSQLRYRLVEKHFSPDTLSRLQLKPIIFGAYDVPQMVDILKQRLDLMLKPEQYEENALFELSKHIRRIGGDMREALDLLRVGVESAIAKLDLPTMRRAIEWGKKRWWKDELTSLPTHWAFLLFLTAREAIQNNAHGAIQSRIKVTYLREAKNMKFDPLSERSIYYVFTQLIDKGYLQASIHGFGRRRATILQIDDRDKTHIFTVGKELDWESLLAVTSLEQSQPILK